MATIRRVRMEEVAEAGLLASAAGSAGTSTASMASLVPRDDIFKAHNELKASFRELTSKFEYSQMLVSQQQAELRALRLERLEAKDVVVEKPEMEVEAIIRSKNEISAKNVALQSRVTQLEDELERLKEHSEELQRELLASNLTSAEQEQALLAARKEAESRVAEASDADRAAKSREVKLRELAEALNSKESRLAQLEAEAARVATHAQEMENAKKTMRRLRSQLLSITQSSGSKVTTLQNLLQGHKQLLQELRLEYEEFTDTMRLERETERATHAEQFNRLRVEFENFKLMQFEDKQQLLREQQEVIKALQTQFEEYRATAEFLFNTEAAKLEEKLNVQMLRYEQEIQYIIKAKDAHFDEMMTSKDAKIMNLIEGTDFHALLVKHETELEELRREHDEELDRVRAAAKEEQGAIIPEMERHAARQELVIEKLHNQLADGERRLAGLVASLDDKNRSMTLQEERHRDSVEKLQRELDKAYAEVERMRQMKEDLRHKIIRMRMRSKGEDSDDLPALCRRLQHELAELSVRYNAMTVKATKLESENEGMARQLLALQQQLTLTGHDLSRRTEEYAKLTRAFETFLKRRAEGVLAATAGTGVSIAKSKRRERGRQEQADPGSMSMMEARSKLAKWLAADTEASVLGARSEDVSDYDDAAVAAAAAGSDATEGMASKQEKKSKQAASRAAVKARTPKKLLRMRAKAAKSGTKAGLEREMVMDLARGFAYLSKFQSLSHAFTSGEFNPRVVAASRHRGDKLVDTSSAGAHWKKMDLYRSLQEAEAERVKKMSHLWGDKPAVHDRTIRAELSGAGGDGVDDDVAEGKEVVPPPAAAAEAAATAAAAAAAATTAADGADGEEAAGPSTSHSGFPAGKVLHDVALSAGGGSVGGGSASVSRSGSGVAESDGSGGEEGRRSRKKASSLRRATSASSELSGEDVPSVVGRSALPRSSSRV